MDIRGDPNFEQGGWLPAGPLIDFEESNRPALRSEAAEREVYGIVGGMIRRSTR